MIYPYICQVLLGVKKLVKSQFYKKLQTYNASLKPQKTLKVNNFKIRLVYIQVGEGVINLQKLRKKAINACWNQNGAWMNHEQ